METGEELQEIGVKCVKCGQVENAATDYNASNKLLMDVYTCIFAMRVWLVAQTSFLVVYRGNTWTVLFY